MIFIVQKLSKLEKQKKKTGIRIVMNEINLLFVSHVNDKPDLRLLEISSSTEQLNIFIY